MKDIFFAIAGRIAQFDPLETMAFLVISMIAFLLSILIISITAYDIVKVYCR